jgi:hypothetical protein
MTNPSHTDLISLFAGARPFTDYHDASSLDHDPYWGFMMFGCLAVVWGCVAVAVAHMAGWI